MIASLRGEVRHIGLDHVVIECGGVGYKVLVAPNTAGAVTRGSEGFLLTSMVVREDSQTLYGFTDAPQQELFHLLQTVQGVGPRLAMAVIAHEIGHVADQAAKYGLVKPDRTKGAMYFHDRNVRPAWASEYIRTAETGKFLFYKPQDGKAK